MTTERRAVAPIVQQTSVEEINRADRLEQIETLRGSYPEPVVARYDNLLTSIRDTSIQNRDPYQRAVFSSLVHELDQDIDFHEILLFYTAENMDDAVSVSHRKIFSSFQELVMPLPRQQATTTSEEWRPGRHKPLVDPKYPGGYTQPWKWQNIIDRLKDDPLEMAQFRLNLINKPLQSSVLSRFAVLVVAKQLFGIEEPNIYSGGCSFGLIEKMMASYREDVGSLPEYTFGNLAGSRQDWFIPSHARTQEFHHLLRNPNFKLGQVLGVDLDPPHDPLTSSYAYSNCFQAREFKDKAYRQIAAGLMLKDLPNMQLITDDYTSPQHVDKVRQKYPEWFQLPNRCVEFVFSEYQQTPEGLAQTTANARELAGDEGYIFQMDFVEKESSGKLRFLERWSNWTANLFVTPPSGEPLHIFRMRNGRGQDIVAGEDLLKAAPSHHRSDPARLDLGKLEFGMMLD